MLKMNFLSLFWLGSGSQARNTQNEPPEAYSGQVLCLRPEMFQNEPPEAYSGQVLGHRPETLKMSFLRPILGRFCA